MTIIKTLRYSILAKELLFNSILTMLSHVAITSNPRFAAVKRVDGVPVQIRHGVALCHGIESWKKTENGMYVFFYILGFGIAYMHGLCIYIYRYYVSILIHIYIYIYIFYEYVAHI